MRVIPAIVLVLLAAAGVELARSGTGPAADGDRAAPPAEAQPATPPTAPAPPTTAPATPAPFVPPTPKSAGERVELRETMVNQQLANPRDGRTPIRKEQVLEAMRAVPRHAFVPEDQRDRAYADMPLPIGHGQTISQPYMVALMTELLELTSESKVLEIGTGSGYQAAILAHLTPEVYTIEIIEPLAHRAEETLRAQGYENVHCRSGDGYLGWPEMAPFDAIIVTCAAGHVPPPLWEQLAAGGRIVIPIGGPYEVQRLVVMEKGENGESTSRTVSAVRFVPLTRPGDE